MDFDPTPMIQTPQPVPAPARRRVSRIAVAGGLAAGMALGGAGIAAAADSGTTTPTTAAPSSNPADPHVGKHPGRGFGGMGGFGFPGVAGGHVLYGQATIQQADGTLKTVEFQVGTVDSVSANSITVASPGHTQTYTVDPSTIVDSQAGGISSVSAKDTVRVIATQVNGKDTATDIVDMTKLKASRAGFGFAGGNGAPTQPTDPADPAPAA